MNQAIKNKLDMIISESFARQPFLSHEDAESNARDNERECLSRPPVLQSSPTRVRLELTNKCNLICVFCYRSHFRSDDKGFLTPKDIDRLDPVLRTAKFISLQQKTETLVSPHIVEILDKIGAYNAVASLNTNLLPLTHEIAEALVRNKVTFVSISVSAFDENYEKLYRGGKLDDLIDRIELLNETKQRLKSDLPRLRMSFVLRKDTMNQLEPALDFCRRHNFSEGIQVLPFIRVVEEDRHLEPAVNWPEYEDTWRRFEEKAEAMAVPVEFGLNYKDGMRPEVCTEYVKVCTEPWESLNITPSGKVIPCVQAAQHMGDIRETDIMEIWNGDELRKFREGMNTKPYNADCGRCYHCRFVSPMVLGDKLSKRETINDTYYRRRKRAKSGT